MKNPTKPGRYLACVYEWAGSYSEKPKAPRWVIKNFIVEPNGRECWERQEYRYDTGGRENIEVVEWQEVPPLPGETPTEKNVSLPKLRLLAVLWAGRNEPNSLQCAKELVRVLLPHLRPKECEEIIAAFMANPEPVELPKKIERGVMVMKDGKAWGCAYSDGHSTLYGWMNPEDAKIHNPEFCKKPSDVTYVTSPNIQELNTGSIVPVERTTTVTILPPTKPKSHA